MRGENMESVIVGAMALVGTLAGTYFSNRKASALIAYRMESLEQKVKQHNQVVERTYKLEGRMTEAEHDIRDLKARREG